MELPKFKNVKIVWSSKMSVQHVLDRVWREYAEIQVVQEENTRNTWVVQGGLVGLDQDFFFSLF